MAIGQVSGAQLGPRGPKGAGVSPEELAAAVQAAIGDSPGGEDPRFETRDGNIYAVDPLQASAFATTASVGWGRVASNVLVMGIRPEDASSGDSALPPYFDEGSGFTIGDKFYWIGGWGRSPYDDYIPAIQVYDLTLDRWIDAIPIPCPAEAPPISMAEVVSWFADWIGEGAGPFYLTTSALSYDLPVLPQLPRLGALPVYVVLTALAADEAHGVSAQGDLFYAYASSEADICDAPLPAGSDWVLMIDATLTDLLAVDAADFQAFFRALPQELRLALARVGSAQGPLRSAQLQGVVGFEGGFYALHDGKLYFGGGDANWWDPDGNQGPYTRREPDVAGTGVWASMEGDSPGGVPAWKTLDLGGVVANGVGAIPLAFNAAPAGAPWTVVNASIIAYNDDAYSVQSDEISVTTVDLIDANFMTLSGLTPGQTYYIRLVVEDPDASMLDVLPDPVDVMIHDVDEAGNGPWSGIEGRWFMSYDPQSGQFETLPTSIGGVDFDAYGVADDKLYTFPGLGGYPRPVYIECYDFVSSEWSRLVGPLVDSNGGQLVVEGSVLGNYLGDTNEGHQYGRRLYFPSAGGLYMNLDDLTFGRVADPQNSETDYFTAVTPAPDGTWWVTRGGHSGRYFIADDGATPIYVRRFDPVTETWSDGPDSNEISLDTGDDDFFYGYMAGAFTPGGHYRLFGASPYVGGQGIQVSHAVLDDTYRPRLVDLFPGLSTVSNLVPADGQFPFVISDGHGGFKLKFSPPAVEFGTNVVPVWTGSQFVWLPYGSGSDDDGPPPNALAISVNQVNFTRLAGESVQGVLDLTDDLLETLFQLRNADAETLNSVVRYLPNFQISDLEPARMVTTYESTDDLRLHVSPTLAHAGAPLRFVPMASYRGGHDLLVVGDDIPWVTYWYPLGYEDQVDRPTTEMGRSDSSSPGNIYVLGGKDTTGALLDSLYSLDPQGGFSIGHSGVATTRPVCALVGVKTDHVVGTRADENPRVYAGLGAVADGTPSAYWGYFTPDNYPQWTWHSLPDAPVARTDFGWALAVYDDDDVWPARSNKIHVFGGRRAEGTSSHQVYDAEADTWSDAASLPEDLGWCVAAMEVADAASATDGHHEPLRIHVIGHVIDADLAGSSVHATSMRYFIYDVATDTWLDDFDTNARGFPKGHQLPSDGPVIGFDLAWIAPQDAERQGYLMMGPGWGDGWDPAEPDVGPYCIRAFAGHVVNVNTPTTWYCEWQSSFALIKDSTLYEEQSHRVGYALASPSQYPVMLNGRHVRQGGGGVDWVTTMKPICIPIVPATNLTPESLAADQNGTPLKVPSNIDDTRTSMMLTRRDGIWRVDRPDSGPAAFDLFGWSMDPAAATGQTSALQPGRIYMSAFPGRSSFVGILHAHMEVLTPSGNGGVLSCALYRWNDLLLRFERLTLSVAHGSDTGGAVVLSFDFDASFQIHNGDGLWRMALLYLGDDPGPALRGASPVQSPLVQATSIAWIGSKRWQEATASVEFPTGVADSLPPYLTRIPNSAQVTVPSQVMPCIVVDR